MVMSFKCPECGQTETFYVSATISVIVDGSNGRIEEVGECPCYDENDMCNCACCEYEGYVRDFINN